MRFRAGSYRKDQLPRQVLKQHRFQTVALHRLCEVVGKSAGGVLLTRPDHHVGGQRDNRGSGIGRASLCTELFQGLNAVHIRHKMIHEYQVVVRPRNQPEALAPAVGGFGPYLRQTEQSLYDIYIELHIVHYQDPCSRRPEALVILLFLTAGGTAVLDEHPDRFV